MECAAKEVRDEHPEKMKLWATKDPKDFVIALNEAIMAKGEYGENFAALTEAERVLCLVDILEMEVNNGGFEQYFDNSSGDHVPETVGALRAIGADWAAELLEKALAPFGDSYPADRDERLGVTDSWGEDAPCYALWDECDDVFYAAEADGKMGLVSYCHAYAMKNKAGIPL